MNPLSLRRLLKISSVFIIALAIAFAGAYCANAQTLSPQTTKTASIESSSNAEVYRFKIGNMNAVVISDGTLETPPLPTYAPTVEPTTVQQSLQERFLSPDQLTLYFNALYLDTGRHKVLVDTGAGLELGPTLGRLSTNLRSAGIAPESIDTVILTHAHPDHLGGIRQSNGMLTYPNARYFVAQAEWSFWTALTIDLSSLKLNEDFKRVITSAARRYLGAIRARVVQFLPGQEIVPGIRAIAAPGHTPGQTALLVTSGNTQFINAADVFFNEAFDLEHPEWQTGFDLDPDQAAATRRTLLDQITAKQILVMAYHMPFPALGHIRGNGNRYEWEPVIWQFNS